MSDVMGELSSFLARYEEANNSHDIEQVAPLIAEDATYWFSDGSYEGLEEITKAIERTFAVIRDEVYEIRDLAWVSVSEDLAVCRFRFAWNGVVAGKPASGQGRGTSVIVNQQGMWKMLHEHLSP